MRYLGVLISLGLFVGCVETDRPVATPSNVDNSPGTPSHTVNKPVIDEKPADFKRGPDATVAPNNTEVNKRDQSPAATTPIETSNDPKDIKLIADIRQQIVNRNGMSINARNVKIMSNAGKVTLRGPVDTQAEKDLISQMANDTAGAANVDNQLEVVPK